LTGEQRRFAAETSSAEAEDEPPGELARVLAQERGLLVFKMFSVEPTCEKPLAGIVETGALVIRRPSNSTAVDMAIFVSDPSELDGFLPIT
jgi:hypothetical protein